MHLGLTRSILEGLLAGAGIYLIARAILRRLVEAAAGSWMAVLAVASMLIILTALVTRGNVPGMHRAKMGDGTDHPVAPGMLLAASAGFSFFVLWLVMSR